MSAAQIAAPGMSSVRYTNYPSAPSIKDPIFIFCNSTGTQKGTLTASSPIGAGPFNFTWYKWNDATRSFSDLIFTESITGPSTVANLDEGGYRVSISGAYDTLMTAWVFFDKTPDAGSSVRGLCYRVDLTGDTAAKVHQFYYRDISNGSVLTLKNEVSFLWSSNPQTYIPAPGFFLRPRIENFASFPNREYRLPTEDITFKFTVNTLGCRNESNSFYEPIHAKADFSAEPVTGEAPLDVVFTDKSLRGSNRYIWDFGEREVDGTKKTWKVNKDSLWIFESPFTHTYYRPGEYTVKLFVESDKFCTDTFTLAARIVVDDSKLEIPNVFTPNGDTFNDNFMVDARSLRWITVEVFSRSGLKVYSFFGDGEILRQWQGWDGNVNNTSIKASPGIYYYIIRALGWDDIEYDSKEYRGFVYLYR